MQMLSRSKDRRSYDVTLDMLLRCSKISCEQRSEVRCGDVLHHFLLPLAAFSHSEFAKLGTFPPRSCRQMILSLKPIPPGREPQMSVPGVSQRRDSREHLLHSCSSSSVLEGLY